MLSTPSIPSSWHFYLISIGAILLLQAYLVLAPNGEASGGAA